PDDQRLPHELATLLQRELITSGWQSGEVIGTLPDIRRRYGLGRWACREAVGILEMRGWLELRRGAGGGLRVTLPTTQHLAKLMLVHLCLKGARVDQVIEARQTVHRVVVRKLMTLDCRGALPDQDFSRWLAAQTGNRTISLLMEFVTALYDECEGTVAVAQVAEQARLWDAVRSGDESRAGAALDDFLEATERLRAGEKVGLPWMFSRDGSETAATYAARLAQWLMKEIAQRAQDGQVDLGNEAEIGERHHLNRDIVRRAIRMLEDIGVVVSRRGANGGLTSREPDLAVIVELIPQLLHQQRVSSREVGEAFLLFKLEAARLSAARVQAGVASAKVTTLAQELRHTTPAQPHELIMMENRLIDLAENDVLAACDRGILFHGPVLPPEFTDPAGWWATRSITNNRMIIEAILAGDVQGAEAALMKKLLDMLPARAPALHSTHVHHVADLIPASVFE
ncbi:MAG: putative Transcription factor, GntR family, partial [Gammaproteobacteria bacterium]|nr:putative Transcription factor, GntR family [Gammaproteobacteria bacterium]